MRMNEVAFESRVPVDGYGPGGFRIAGEWYEGAQILLPSGIAPLDGGLTPEATADLIAAASEIDVVLIGMGADIAPLPAPLRSALEEAGIGVEIMSTPSACRTFNVLLTEDRRVAAILLPV